MAQNQNPIESLSGIDFTEYTTIVLLAWNYSDAIIKKLENTDLDYLIPLPQLKRIASKHRKGGRA
jgi:hypothetical protein